VLKLKIQTLHKAENFSQTLYQLLRDNSAPWGQLLYNVIEIWLLISRRYLYFDIVVGLV
jgi:hypothetical protein